MTRPIITVLTLLPLLAQAAFAQGNRGNQQEDPVLPELAPREVEILGELEIALPALQRQPLVGFNPPPRVADIPAGRKPYTENFLDDQTDLPQSPLQRPDLPDISSLAGLAPINGEFEAGAGRYFSRVVRGRSALPISGTTSFYGRLDYEGSDGHAPVEATPDVTSDFDDLTGHVGLQNIFSRVIAGVEADGLYRRYALFGAIDPSGGGSDIHPNREAAGGGGSLWLRTHGDTRTEFQARLRYGGSRFEIPVSDGASRADLIRQEQRFDVSSKVVAPIGSGRLFADVAFATSAMDEDAVANDGIDQLDAGGGFGFLVRRVVNLRLGGRIMTFSTGRTDPLLDVAGEDEPAVYFAPDILAELFPARGLRLYAQNAPGLEAHSLAGLFERNPFLVAEPMLLPTVRTVNAEAGAGLYAGPVKLAARAGYQFAPSYLFFEDAEPLADASGYRHLSQARYGEAEIMFAGGDLSVVLPGGLQATVGGTFREGRLTSLDVDIPNFGPLTGHAMLALPFARSKGLLQAVATYESARYIDVEKSRELGDFFDLDTALFYNVTDALGIVARVNNISAGYLERWNRHPQAPLVVMGGLRVQW